MTERTKAMIYLVITALLWSVGGVLIKWVKWHPVAIAGMRSAIAALFLWAVVRRPKFDWSLAQIGGGVAYAVTVLLYVTAVKLTTAANAILLQYTAPIWVALFGTWFLKERPTWFDWVSVAASLIGMALFFREGLARQSLLGDTLAALSGVTIAWITLFLRKQKAGSPIESVLLGNMLAALISLPFWFTSWPDVRSWVGLIILGLFQLGLSWTLYAMAVKHVTALEAVLVSMLEPILNPIWVALLIGEVPTLWAMAGGVLVVGMVIARGAYAVMLPRMGRFQRASHLLE